MDQPKKYRIRECDDIWSWDTNSGNGDALCNEESNEENVNFDSFDGTYSESYQELIENRKKKRNTELCSKCVYNDKYCVTWLSRQEARKIKLIQLKRENKYGKVEPDHLYLTLSEAKNFD